MRSEKPKDEKLLKKEERKPGNWCTLDQYLRRDKLMRPRREVDSKLKQERTSYYG